MSYFNSFPLVLYDMKGDRKKLVTDIIKRVKVRHKILDENLVYIKSILLLKVKNHEDVAFKHFGKSDLHWVILLTNNITDAYYG